MKTIFLAPVLAIAALVSAAPSLSQEAAKPEKSSAPAKGPAAIVNRAALQLKPEITSQHQRIQDLLPAETRQKLAHMAPGFAQQLRASKKGTNFSALAAAAVRKEFPHVSPQQADVLTFALLKDGYDNSLGDMSQEDQLLLQQEMDRKSQLESSLSNLLKKISDTSSSIIQNIK